MNLRNALRAVIPIALVAVAMSAITRNRTPDGAMVDLRKVPPFEVSIAGFTLPGRQEVSIEALGASRGSHWVCNAWVIDARTRNVVWKLGSANMDERKGGLTRFDGTVELPAGEYLVYYAMFARPDDLRSWITRALGSVGFADDFHMTVIGNGKPLSDAELDDMQQAFAASSFVSFTGLREEARERTGFSVAVPTEVEIYAIGEVLDDEGYDYGWLVNTETGEVLWKLDAAESQHAGGAEKNRMERTVLTLEPGSYAAFAVTDGSHDASDWNAAPPFDPDYWGLTIRTMDEESEVEVYDYRPVPLEHAFVTLIGVGDDATLAQGFSLSRSMPVRIRALGEGTGGSMHDYGWILDAATHHPVWIMEYENTEDAGGASKNRLVDDVVTLDAGSYLVYYTSDGSHSFEDWNASPPMEPEVWGITLLPASGGPADGVVEGLDPTSHPSALAALTRIGDDETRSTSFSLNRESEIRVYALGEGSGGSMYDYAWIEEATSGGIVWQMDYQETVHAGGGDKNRMIEGTLTLPAGGYTLKYKSDGSHSFDGWNVTAPFDPLNYGVTIYPNR